MTEGERVRAIPRLMDWARDDDTVQTIVKCVLLAEGQPAIGHLARFCPATFDALYEEAEFVIKNEN